MRKETQLTFTSLLAGVSCVLLGMRHPSYVADGLEILKWPPHPAPTKLYRAAGELAL